MGKTLENKFFNILSSLDSIWAKIAIIGIFVCTGFKFGCYYKETQMKLEQHIIYKLLRKRMDID